MKFFIIEDLLYLNGEHEYKINYYDFIIDFLNVGFDNNGNSEIGYMDIIMALEYLDGSTHYSDTKKYVLVELATGYLDKINPNQPSNLMSKEDQLLLLKELQIYLAAVISDNFSEFTVQFDSSRLLEINFDTKLSYEFIKYENKLYKYYEFNDIYSYSLFAISKFYNSKKIIKECRNCGEYFVPQTRNDEVFCDRIHRNNRTCKAMGYEKRVKENPVKKEYRRIYKNKNAFMNRQKNDDPDVVDKFRDWTRKASQIVEKFNDHIISKEEALKWLKENERW